MIAAIYHTFLKPPDAGHVPHAEQSVVSTRPPTFNMRQLFSDAVHSVRGATDDDTGAKRKVKSTEPVVLMQAGEEEVEDQYEKDEYQEDDTFDSTTKNKKMKPYVPMTMGRPTGEKRKGALKHNSMHTGKRRSTTAPDGLCKVVNEPDVEHVAQEAEEEQEREEKEEEAEEEEDDDEETEEEEEEKVAEDEEEYEEQEEEVEDEVEHEDVEAARSAREAASLRSASRAKVGASSSNSDARATDPESDPDDAESYAESIEPRPAAHVRAPVYSGDATAPVDNSLFWNLPYNRRKRVVLGTASAGITFDQRRFVHTRDNGSTHTVPGLLVSLRDSFFPAWNINSIKPDAAPADAVSSHRTQDEKLTGLSLGQHVDHEVSFLIELVARHNIDLGSIVEQKELRGDLPVRVVDMLRGGRRWMHPYTWAVLRVLHLNHLIPVASQVICADKSKRIATMIDFICVHEQNRTDVILVELKCGFDTYLDKYVEQMGSPFGAYTDSCHNQHRLQVLFGYLLFSDTFPKVTVSDCVVIRVHKRGVDFEPLPASMKKMLTDKTLRPTPMNALMNRSSVQSLRLHVMRNIPKSGVQGFGSVDVINNADRFNAVLETSYSDLNNRVLGFMFYEGVWCRMVHAYSCAHFLNYRQKDGHYFLKFAFYKPGARTMMDLTFYDTHRFTCSHLFAGWNTPNGIKSLREAWPKFIRSGQSDLDLKRMFLNHLMGEVKKFRATYDQKQRIPKLDLIEAQELDQKQESESQQKQRKKQQKQNEPQEMTVDSDEYYAIDRIYAVRGEDVRLLYAGSDKPYTWQRLADLDNNLTSELLEHLERDPSVLKTLLLPKTDKLPTVTKDALNNSIREAIGAAKGALLKRISRFFTIEKNKVTDIKRGH